MYLIGIAAFLFTFLTPLTLKGVDLHWLSNPSAILPPLFAVVSALIATRSFKLFTRGLNAAVSRKYYMPDEERRRAAELFRLLSKVTIAVTLFTMFASAIALLGNPGDIEAVCHATVSLLIAPIFAIALLIAIFEPAAFILRRPADAPTERAVKAYPKALGDKLLELCYQSGLSAEDIENATEIELRSEPRQGEPPAR